MSDDLVRTYNPPMHRSVVGFIFVTTHNPQTRNAMNEQTYQHDDQLSDGHQANGSRESKIKPVRKLAKWSIPLAVAIVLCIGFGFYLLPFGLVFFIAALILVGFATLWRETPEEDEISESLSD